MRVIQPFNIFITCRAETKFWAIRIVSKIGIYAIGISAPYSAIAIYAVLLWVTRMVGQNDLGWGWWYRKQIPI